MEAIICFASLSRAGKSTIAACLAAELALRGHETLLVDADPRADATAHFMSPEEVSSSVADALVGVRDEAARVTSETFPLGGIVCETPVERLGIVPGHVCFALFERAAPAAVVRLKAELDDIASCFDYALIDTPASLGLTLSACLARPDSLGLPSSLDTRRHAGHCPT